MSQILDALPTRWHSTQILCCYRNYSQAIQVVRITNIPGWYFERVVFAGEQLLFTALPTAILEIHAPPPLTSLLADQIPCRQLQVLAE